jgi:hypothetical protein
LNEQMISVGRVAASDIREAPGTGLFFPVKASDPTLLLTGEPGSRHAIKLTGGDRYNRFGVSLKTACAGLFVPDVQLRVDLASRLDAAGLTETRGTVILSDNSVALVTGVVGDTWGDPGLFQLPFAVSAGCDSTRIAFAWWTLGVMQDDTYVPLWEPTDVDPEVQG